MRKAIRLIDMQEGRDPEGCDVQGRDRSYGPSSDPAKYQKGPTCTTNQYTWPAKKTIGVRGSPRIIERSVEVKYRKHRLVSIP